MNKQQTAVDNLYNEMYKIIEFYAGNEQLAKCMVLRKQAKEMEKEQKADTWNNAINAVEKDKWESFEQFYDLTYGGKK
jgi:hypothetical protein